MKQGKRPTRAQKKLLINSGLNPNNWLVEKNLVHDHKLYLVHRETGKPKVIAV
ncbi:DUF6906 family protein [Metabacillus litoralis]|uniref:DUF6906 family protein n=1 Tax=Metabacillus litoralis TaxID=152268 RepID=UPI00203ECB37|nr:hypothetical protein [Metabacillus litoralis]MCM3411251.1 hypothetical protein [Metabacillus litoralis]